MYFPTLQRIGLVTLFCAFITMGNESYANSTFVAPVSNDHEINVERYLAKGDYLMLWFAPEYGLRDNHRALARALTRRGIEVWLSDIADSLFLPQGSATLKKLDGKYIADLIEVAHQQTGKKIAVMGDSYATLAALSGARQWQSRQHNQAYFIGAVLFSPYTYAYVPRLGELPEYMPIVSATNIPMVIYQAKNSGIISQFSTLLEKLQQNGSPVYTRTTPGVMSLFYEKEPSVQMVEQAKKIPVHLSRMLSMLEKHEVPRRVIPLEESKKYKSGIDVYLREFKGTQAPAGIALENIKGQLVKKVRFTGKVTVINFWATWCPPCVEEIPSLNRLSEKMNGQPFELISINYAEDKATVQNFMRKVNVEFPVLLDKDGAFAKQWRVISFPSTFVIGPDGAIKYGVNAAIHWDDPDLIARLKSLLP